MLPRITDDGAAGTRPGSLDAELRSTLYPSELLHTLHVPINTTIPRIVPRYLACWATSVKVSLFDPALDNGDRFRTEWTRMPCPYNLAWRDYNRRRRVYARRFPKPLVLDRTIIAITIYYWDYFFKSVIFVIFVIFYYYNYYIKYKYGLLNI